MKNNRSAFPSVTVLASMIDHTLLKPDATPDQAQVLCEEAVEYGFASVCVNPCYVRRAASRLEGTTIKVSTVIGFPLGATTTRAKKEETDEALQDGAGEVDMVINIGMLKAKQDAYVRDEIAAVAQAAGAGAPVKVIIETALLGKEEKIRVCRLAMEAGARFVKTSTGFANGGATADDVRLMREIVGRATGVKAAGGIRDYPTAVAMVEAGANRLGTTSSVAIMQQARASLDKRSGPASAVFSFRK